MNELLGDIIQAIINGEDEEVEKLIRKSIELGIEPLKILNEGLIKGLRILGDKFNQGEIFLPDLMLGAEAAKKGLKLIEPELRKLNVQREFIGTVVIGTVEGDIHDIGKSIVSIMLEVNGFKVYDLGVDVPTEIFVKKVEELKPDILGLSALLSTTMVKQREVIEALNKKGIRNKVKVMIGGAPITSEWAEEIGADGYAIDAITAVNRAKELIKVLKEERSI
jgi:5-methyltetrahydrofolate--homocysteine methyltransferase